AGSLPSSRLDAQDLFLRLVLQVNHFHRVGIVETVAGHDASVRIQSGDAAPVSPLKRQNLLGPRTDVVIGKGVNGPGPVAQVLTRVVQIAEAAAVAAPDRTPVHFALRPLDLLAGA